MTAGKAPAHHTVKVLFVINSLGAGGAEQSLAELLVVLEAGGILPIVVCLTPREEGVQTVVLERGTDVRFLRPGPLLRQLLELGRLIRSEAPDVVHTTIFEADLLGRLASIGSRSVVLTSLVNTSYDPVRLDDPHVRRSRLRLVQAVDGWSARHLTNHFHAITGAVESAAVAQLGLAPEMITVISRGRDARRLGEPGADRKRLARRRLNIADSDEVILTVGRQEYQKGQRHLLDSFELLAPDRPRLRLVLAGRQGNSSEELLGLLERSRFKARVQFLGHRDDVPDLLAAADVFVFPSLYEGLGGAVIEAMALALPIVASDIPALREVVDVDRNALLVPAGSPAALAEAVKTLLDDPRRLDAFGQRSREIFLDRFTLERSASRMLQLYDDLLNPAMPPPVGARGGRSSRAQRR